METKTVFGTTKYQIETCLSETGNGKGGIIEGVSLLLHQNGKIKLEDGQLVSIQLTKEDAKELAIQLLKISGEPVPERGVSLDHYEAWGISLHHAKEENGEPANEPIICISDIESEDIPEDNQVSICLTNESAKEMIGALAMIV